MLNWLQTSLAQLIIRHAATVVGAWFVEKGILNGDQTTQVTGALAVLFAVGHSIWTKRAIVFQELHNLANPPTK